MPRPSFSQRIVADLRFSAREPGRDDLRDVVQWQMPDAVMRRFRAEARRQGTDLNTFIRDFVCAALTERAEAIRRMVHQLDGHDRAEG
jgi:hypothetical protein